MIIKGTFDDAMDYHVNDFRVMLFYVSSFCQSTVVNKDMKIYSGVQLRCNSEYISIIQMGLH